MDIAEARSVLADHQRQRTLWQRVTGAPGVCSWCLLLWPCSDVAAALKVLNPFDPPEWGPDFRTRR